MSEQGIVIVPPEAAGQRLDQFLTSQLDGVSRSRVQLLLEQGDVLVDGGHPKASLKLRGGESIVISGEPRPAPLKAIAEDIPLQVVFEDANLAVIDKPAGMMVHAGSGQTEDARNRGTLVNALLHRFRALSNTSGELRPGIVHRLDKDTSGLIIVAKNDRTHAALAEMFSTRQVKKTYIALVHGSVERAKGTITAAIGRDPMRRTRMTTRVQEDGRSAVSHYEVVRRLATRFGKFTLVRVRIETGPHPPDSRAHGFDRASGGGRHPLRSFGSTYRSGRDAGGSLEGRPAESLSPRGCAWAATSFIAAELEFSHPKTEGRAPLSLASPLPGALDAFLERLERRRRLMLYGSLKRPKERQVIQASRDSHAAFTAL